MSITSSKTPPGDLAAIQQAHQLYGQLTGQTLRLAFDRERMWYELLRTGYTLQDLRTVITYLQREIHAQRRNVGALKLSNLLQPDRFEEDLQISRVRLRPTSAPCRSLSESPRGSTVRFSTSILRSARSDSRSIPSTLASTGEGRRVFRDSAPDGLGDAASTFRLIAPWMTWAFVMI